MLGLAEEKLEGGIRRFFANLAERSMYRELKLSQRIVFRRVEVRLLRQSSRRLVEIYRGRIYCTQWD